MSDLIQLVHPSSTGSGAALPVLRPRPYPLPELRPGEFYVEPLTPGELGGGPLWCVEDSDPFDLYTYRVTKILAAQKTAFQNVVVAQSCNYGRVVFMDGAIQSAEEDEELYHEMLVQPAMLLHPEPRDVLIIGGGEGATLREVLAHKSVRTATMVDIDREAVELFREHLTRWHQGAFEDPRVRLYYEDGRAFIERLDSRYDVVVIDVVDAFEGGPAERLYTRQFYELLRTRLRPGAIVIVQGLELSVADYKEHAALTRTLRTVFSEVHSFKVGIPSFLGTWGFLIASDWARPDNWRADNIDRVIEQKVGTSWLSHLDGEFLLASFVHDKGTRYLLGLPGPILEDDRPYLAPPDVDDVEIAHAKLPVLD
jgi:spermidine synthase